ncbi:hypothetical protein [Microbacterium sp. P04]|uniref:hypothetical protein n=1 Tax=Microbacterium sp. P04 TaxID=3366947 RepID=UPI0037474858
MPRRTGPLSTTARWLVGVLIAVLAVATVLLVVLALQSVRPQPVPDGAEPVSTYTPRAESTPTPTATPSATPVATETPDAAATLPRDRERFLSLGSQGWWRATAGACGGASPVVEHSTDGGETWEDVTPRYRALAQVASLDSFAGSEAEMVAAVGGGCETQALRTFTQGEFWQPYEDVLAASRFLEPGDAAAVVTPQGNVAAPCADARSFRAVGDIVALLCDGTGYALGSGGQWAALPATDAVALAVSNGTVLTAGPAAGCDGLAVTRWTGPGFATAQPLGCAAGASAPAAVAALGDSAAVWSGAELVRVG